MKSAKRYLSISSVFALLLASLSFAACKQSKGGPPPGMKTPVLVAAVAQEAIAEEIRSVGDIAGDENVELRSEIDGRITGITFTEGQVVEKGAVLVQVEPEKLKASLAEARANFNLAKANRTRNYELLQTNTISQKEFDQAEAAFLAARATVNRLEQDLGDSKLRAPFKGVVGTRLVSPGQYVQKGQAVTSIVSLEHVKAEFTVPERYLADLRTGLEVRTLVAAYPDKEFIGELYYISPEVDLETRTVLLKARIANPNMELRAGMLAETSTIVEVRENSLTIPESAVLLQQGTARVFVPNAEGSVELREVSLGKQLPGKVEILKGLQAGELVVTEGVQKIGPGAPIAYQDPSATPKESPKQEVQESELRDATLASPAVS